MADFTVGQRVRVRSRHTGCTWCAALRGRTATVLALTKRDGDFLEVMLEADGGQPRPVLLKVECIEESGRTRDRG